LAIVKAMTHQPLERESKHTEVECTFDVIVESNGRKYLQLDTYGSNQRQMRGKKSQSLRLAPEAIQQLKVIFSKYGL
jgi:hypothetical protein